MGFEWDAAKAKENFRKHGVRFEEAIPVFDDPKAITIIDDESDPSEQRFISIGLGERAQVLVVVYCYREESFRMISTRKAEPHERDQYSEE